MCGIQSKWLVSIENKTGRLSIEKTVCSHSSLCYQQDEYFCYGQTKATTSSSSIFIHSLDVLADGKTKPIFENARAKWTCSVSFFLPCTFTRPFEVREIRPNDKYTLCELIRYRLLHGFFFHSPQSLSFCHSVNGDQHFVAHRISFWCAFSFVANGKSKDATKNLRP